MLKKLRIQNFKGWKDTGTIDMAPITLFFGANSSGKSSIGQFLMMLKQTVENPDRKAVFHPGGNNSPVELGSYKEMVYQHDLKNKIKFEYQWSLNDQLKIKKTGTKEVFIGDVLNFESEVYWKDNTQTVERFAYELMSAENKVLYIDTNRKGNGKLEYEVKQENYGLTRNQGRAWPLGVPVRFYGFPDEMVAYYKNADFVQLLNLSQENFFRSLSYLGPLREKAKRIYSWGGNNPESTGYSGENTIAAVLAAKNKKINFGSKKKYSLFEVVIATKLHEMGLVKNFKINPISENRQDYEVKVTTGGEADWVDIPDVGFGVSQVLPVIVQCFYAPKNSIILMEQPEIHLHPSAQSALADVMIDAIRSREDNKNRNIQLIIETHSEHFLRRLQRRIAEGVLCESEVRAYFANTTTSPAHLDPLMVDSGGNIRNWPPQFFGDIPGDVIGQTKAALEKRKKQKIDATGQKSLVFDNEAETSYKMRC